MPEEIPHLPPNEEDRARLRPWARYFELARVSPPPTGCLTYTGPDRYLHMEVQITRGPLKLLRAIVLGSRLVNDELFLDIETSNQAVKTRLLVSSNEVKELQ